MSVTPPHHLSTNARTTGMDGEHFNPEIMQAASSTGLHRHMSWVMAESGVPWEANDDAWCCPECFILFSLNVFRVRKISRSRRGEKWRERDTGENGIIAVNGKSVRHTRCG